MKHRVQKSRIVDKTWWDALNARFVREIPRVPSHYDFLLQVHPHKVAFAEIKREARVALKRLNAKGGKADAARLLDEYVRALIKADALPPAFPLPLAQMLLRTLDVKPSRTAIKDREKYGKAALMVAQGATAHAIRTKIGVEPHALRDWRKLEEFQALVAWNKRFAPKDVA